MKLITSMAKRKSLTRRKIALLCVVAICVSVAALATPNAGVLFNTISRATVEAFDAGFQNGNWQIHLDTNGPSDIVTQTITFLPGGISGWHSHPGPSIASITAGTLTLYDGNDPDCTPHVFSAGTAFVEPGGVVHIARNEGANAATVNVTYIVPRDAPQRIDQPSPGNCPF